MQSMSLLGNRSISPEIIYPLRLKLVFSEVQNCYDKDGLWEVCCQRSFTGSACYGCNPEAKSGTSLTPLHTCIYKHAHIWTQTHTQINQCMWIHTYAHVHTRVCMCTYVCTNTHKYTHVHTYAFECMQYTYMHMYTCTYVILSHLRSMVLYMLHIWYSTPKQCNNFPVGCSTTSCWNTVNYH